MWCMALFITWIVMFTIFFQILGLEIFLDNYVGMKLEPAYLLYTYRNTIGDVSPPIYTYWLAQSEKEGDFYVSWLMISIIWFFWFLNQWVVLIIVMNILIAIISQCYDEFMGIKMNYLFDYQSQMNLEVLLYLKTFWYLPKLHCLVISTKVGAQKEFENQWQGFV